MDWFIGEGGAHLDVRDSNGSSNFGYACLSGWLQWIQVLIRARCDTAAVDDIHVMLSLQTGWNRDDCDDFGNTLGPITTDCNEVYNIIVKRLLRCNLASVPWSPQTH